MKKKHLYLIFSVISIICLFALAASCNMCGHTITNETEEEIVVEESVSRTDETQSGGAQRDTQTQDQSDDREGNDDNLDVEVNHDPIITIISADDVELGLSDEFETLTGENTNFLVLAEDEDGDELSYSATDSIGNNMEIVRRDNNTAEFVWVAPSDVGSYEIYIEVSDGNEGVASETVQVAIVGGVGPSGGTHGFTAVASMSGQVNDNGTVFISADSSGSPSIYIGDQAADLQTRGFLSFNVSDIAGKNVTGAWLTIRSGRIGDPTSLLREMRISSTNYGNSLDGADYESSTTTLTSFFPLTGADFSFTNEALINAVQDTLSAGRQYFQLKLFIDSVSNNHIADGFTVYISDVQLEVEYTD